MVLQTLNGWETQCCISVNMALHLEEDVNFACGGVVRGSLSSGGRRAGGDTGCGWV